MKAGRDLKGGVGEDHFVGTTRGTRDPDENEKPRQIGLCFEGKKGSLILGTVGGLVTFGLS